MVFAVHTVEGRTQYSRMSLDNGSLYLHSLQDMSPPFNAAILQVSLVLSPSPHLQPVARGIVYHCVGAAKLNFMASVGKGN